MKWFSHRTEPWWPFVYYLDEHGGRFCEHGGSLACGADRYSRRVAHGGSGASHLSPGRRGGCLCPADLGRETGCDTARNAGPDNSLGHDSRLPKTSRSQAAKTSRPQGRTSGRQTPDAATDRPAAGASFVPLPALRG